jgi:hypothetical protein
MAKPFTNITMSLVLISSMEIPGRDARTPAKHEVQSAAAKGTVTDMCSRVAGTVKVTHAYHNEPPAGPLPATLDPAQFADNKSAYVAYSIAAKIREVLYQEPCYCPCDKQENHRSLLDCYTSRHGIGCRKCQAEVFFVYEQSRAGKTAREIRERIENGDAWNLDITTYTEAHYPTYKH